MKFTYRWGQRPLAGYTLKRGLGQGGFGEVYFAVSDGGKEVALKLIRGQAGIELRGIKNCLNLKHPNLVHLFDLAADEQGDRWLVMEYIEGEPLSVILERHPGGLSERRARHYFLQAADAVAYLHDHGVVHRDIKPGNLFIENGIAKLGDYGLSKSVSGGPQAQSSNVGTIHYMAPEVSSGAYSKQIDIYACGVMLYEMLTGELPFKGESWAEIAIKHQTDVPDMKKVPADYVRILEKALHKNAERRFANMKEMIQAVEAIGKPNPPREPEQSKKPNAAQPAPRQQLELISSWRGKVSELSTSLLLAPLPAIPATAVWAVFTKTVNWNALGSLFLTMVAVAWAVMIAAKIWEGQKRSQARRLTLGLFGALIGCLAFWLDGWSFPEVWVHDEPLPAGLQSYWGGTLRGEQGSLDMLAGYMIFFTFALMIPRWWQAAERRRRERFSFFPVIATGFWGFILFGLWKSQMWPHELAPMGYLILALAGAAAAIQIVSPFTATPPSRPRFRRRLYDNDR